MVTVNAVPLLAAILLVSASSSALPRVDSGVHRALRQQATVNLIVTMKKSTKDVLEAIEVAPKDMSRGERIERLVLQLQRQAKSSQRDVATLFALESKATQFSRVASFWISNQLFIEGATASLVERLAAHPSIAEIREELVLKLPEVVVASSNSTSTLGTEWGVDKIQAPSVWADGNTGQGIIVSAIDTGVRGSHEALKANFRGDYGWFDPEKKAAAPYDNNGHGSHTMGTIAGANGIGVAPGAKWMACKGCRSDGCPESDLLACGQFITCPTDPSGNNKDCSKAPHLVSNSWGGGQGDTFYKATVDAWQAAGIIPIFANGNSGPDCASANSPADYTNVIAVGATDVGDGLASFSSKGPSKSGLLKPDLSAPGANVRSAWSDGDSSYKSISGTSMATPHVAGATALLLAANPALKYDDVRNALVKGVDTSTLKPAGQTCGGTADGTFPNNNFGFGRVNIKKAIAGGSGPSPSPTSSRPASTRPTPSSTAQTPSPPPSKPAPSHCAPLAEEQCTFWNLCQWDERTKTCLPIM
ncbi:hypothetical protein ATCC90586_008690 [Pythium insidiosum]|nr:hypothetical protein ATCC90586_008690 [Pythium insidiosum]